MKVLQINAVNGIRSTGRNVAELGKHLIDNGYDSIVAYSQSPFSVGYTIVEKFGKKVHGLLSRITGLQGYYSTISTLKFLTFIKHTNPDIVHIRNLHSNFINMKILFNYLAKNNISTFITLHDCWFYTGEHTHYTTDEFYDWRDGFTKQNRDKNKMGNPSWFFDKSEKIFNDQIKWFSKIPRLAFVGVSNWISEEAKKSKVTEGSQIYTIHNWIDLEIFRPINNSELKIKLNLNDMFVILG